MGIEAQEPTHRTIDRPARMATDTSITPVPDDDSPPIETPPLIKRKEFSRLPTISQLRTCYEIAQREDVSSKYKRLLRAEAIMGALTMSSRDRKRHGILLVAVGERTEDGKIAEPSSPFELFNVFAAFPYDEKNDHFVYANKIDLSTKLTKNIRELVNEQADDIRGEELSDRQSRLLIQVRVIDEVLRQSEAKRGHTTTELHQLKRQYLLEYLQASMEMQYKHKKLTKELFRTEELETGDIRVEMNFVREKTLNARLADPEIQVYLVT